MLEDLYKWNFIIQELDLPLIKVTSTELVSGVSGESEENIRLLFEKAVVSELLN